MDQEILQALKEAAEGFKALTETTHKVGEEFDEFGNELDASQKRERARQAAIDQAAKQREAEQNAAIQKYKEKVKKQTEVVAGSINAFTNFGKSIASSPGSFGALNSVVGIATKAFSALASKIPFVGGAVAGLGEAAGEVAKMMIDSFEKSYTIFEQLTDVGVVNKFQEMTASADALGLTFADTQKVLSKNSKELSNFGGSAITGRKEFEKIAYASADARRNFQKLGISAEEFSDFQLSYIAQQQRYNRGQTKSTQELAEGSQRYIKELDALSKLTGVSRKQLQAEQEARLRDTRYRAGIANLPKETREGIDSFLGQLKQVAPGVEEGMKDLIASGGVPVTEAGKAAMLALEQGGLNVRELVKKLREGGISGYKAFQQIANAAGKAGDKFQGLAGIVGDNILLTKNFVELRELEAKRTTMTEEEYKKQRAEIEETIKAQGDQNSELANAKTAMYNASKNIEQLATSSTMVTKAINFMAKGVEYLTEKLYELSGKEMPAHIQARKEEREAIETLAKEKQYEAERDKTIKELEEKRAKGTITLLERAKLAFQLDQKRTQQQVLKDAEAKVKEAAEKRKIAETEAGVKQEPSETAIPQAPKEDPRIARLKEQEEGWAAAAKNYADDLKNLKEQLAKAELDKNEKEIFRLTEEKKLKLEQLTNANKQKETATKELLSIQTAKERAEREAKASKVTGGAKPATAASTSGASATAAPTGGVPATAAPTGGVPATAAPTGGVPATAAPTGGVPAQAPDQKQKVDDSQEGKSTGGAPAEKEKSKDTGIQGATRKLTDGIIYHHTGGRNLAGAQATLKARGLAYHYMIDRDGTIIPYAPDNTVAYHAGKTNKKPEFTNLNTIGIAALANNDEDVTKEQVEAAIKLHNQLAGTYGFSSSNAFGHGETSSHKMSTEGFTISNAIRTGKIPKAANGALIQPSSGGTLVQVAEAGQPEAIVPLPNGRSIPVTITNHQPNSTEKIIESFNDKFDTIIDLLSRGNSIQDNIARNMA